MINDGIGWDTQPIEYDRNVKANVAGTVINNQ